MKILLLYPPPTDIRESGTTPASFPLGLAYIAAILEKAQYNVRAIDLYYKKWDDIEKIIKDESPQVVGITCLSFHRTGVFKLIEIIKSVNKGIRIVLGGPHTAFMYEQILKNYPVDAVVIGEGEQTFLNLIKAWENNISLDNVKGIAFFDGIKIVKTESAELIEDLDSIPLPAYHFFDLDSYGSYGADDPVYEGKIIKNLKFISIVGSRGCVGRCQFCSTSKFWGYKWRTRSPKNIVDEIEYLNKKYHRELFCFVDDIFTVNKKWVMEICQEIINRRLDILWICETRVDMVSETMLKLMKQSGCYRISYGVESASPDILGAINKKASLEQTRQSFQITRNAGITSQMLLMVGNPGESTETIKMTANLLKEVRPDFFKVSLTKVLPGTALYELAKSKGMIDDDYWLSSLSAPIYTAENKLSQLIKWSDRLLYAGSKGISKIIRWLRLFVEEKTNIRLTRNSIEFLGKDRIIKLIG
ncbi:MAG: cobalamin-dependent protein [Planctomycetota bacterium]